jgi:putative transposase
MYELINQLPDLKEEEPWLKDVPSQALQQVVKRLQRTYENFFRGAGFPKFAKRGKYNSILFPQGVAVKDGKVKLPKLGWIRYFYDGRNISGKVKQITVTHEVDGFYAAIAVEETCNDPVIPNENQVGIDVGITRYATLSDNIGNVYFVDNPRTLIKYERKLRIAQRALSRKKKGSYNWYKQKRKVAKLYLKIRRIRQDFLHKLSSSIVKQYGYISVEDLKVSNMIRFGNLSKHISDASWGEFVRQLAYKSEWNGNILQKVNPKYTSQTCSECGAVDSKSRLSQAEFVCIACGFVSNADDNAALNILRAGQALWALT